MAYEKAYSLIPEWNAVASAGWGGNILEALSISNEETARNQ
jgi:hypothetical protein